MTRDNSNQQEVPFSCFVRAGTSTLALNCANNRLIAAGQQNFQLFSIELIDNIEQFKELYDFRNAPRQPSISRYAFQPKDVTWNPKDEHCFATTSGTAGNLYIWDAVRLLTVAQLNIHSSIINRLQFHPQNPYLLLTASQDGYAKLLDIRLNKSDKVVALFRHPSKEGFRHIDINLLNTNKFASVINDQYCVPIWDIRHPTKPDFSILTRDKVLCVAWNPHEHFWLATGGVGGHDRTIRIWDAKGNDNTQEPLFTVYTYGPVAKLSWRPTCLYHIASFTRTIDQRIHVWDIRRAYLPQMSFCHHRNDVEDFLWKSNTDNIISVGRDERLIHSHISSAVQSEQIVPIFSLNVTPKGSVCVSTPNMHNDYVYSLCRERQIPFPGPHLRMFYSHETMSTFSKWNKIIKGESSVGIYSNGLNDNSLQVFYEFARQWTFGNGDKSLLALANICDRNSIVAEQLNRPDLKATWQILKMIYIKDDRVLENYPNFSAKTSRSLSKIYGNNDLMSSNRYYRRVSGRRLLSFDKQQDNRFNGELTNIDILKLQHRRNRSNSKLGLIDDADTNVFRDVLTDDIIFITSEDMINNSFNHDTSYDPLTDIEFRTDSFFIPLVSEDILASISTDGYDNNFQINQSSLTYPQVITIDDDDENKIENGNDFHTKIDIMQSPTNSAVFEDRGNFFTIDESYCPTMQSHTLNFDEIIRQTLLYYIDNNELQVAVHLLLALYPHLNEQKRKELFNGAHLQWLDMYIELLQQLRFFIKAKQLIKHCIENEGIPLSYNTTEFDGTIFFTVHAPTHKRLAIMPSPSTPLSNKPFPPPLKEFMCSICRLPCRAQFSFCGVCTHGGHIDHIQTWFKFHDECPYGCGHKCLYLDNSKRRSVLV